MLFAQQPAILVLNCFQWVPDKLNEKSFWLTVKEGQFSNAESDGESAESFKLIVENFSQKKADPGKIFIRRILSASQPLNRQTMFPLS